MLALDRHKTTFTSCYFVFFLYIHDGTANWKRFTHFSSNAITVVVQCWQFLWCFEEVWTHALHLTRIEAVLLIWKRPLRLRIALHNEMRMKTKNTKGNMRNTEKSINDEYKLHNTACKEISIGRIDSQICTYKNKRTSH